MIRHQWLFSGRRSRPGEIPMPLARLLQDRLDTAYPEMLELTTEEILLLTACRDLVVAVGDRNRRGAKHLRIQTRPRVRRRSPNVQRDQFAFSWQALASPAGTGKPLFGWTSKKNTPANRRHRVSMTARGSSGRISRLPRGQPTRGHHDTGRSFSPFAVRSTLDGLPLARPTDAVASLRQHREPDHPLQ